ncbi:MAG: inverse autotransporter beta domain-containing protein [Parachlamydiales bacterium]|nr:inverse autotransporter beta domain-containing protein [Parachlamydiales bacterium]
MKKSIFFLLFTSFLASQECETGPRPCRIDVKHLEYQGIGFNQGYTSLDLFLSHPDPIWDSAYCFLDTRAHVFNNGRPAVNAGVGCRYVFDSLLDAIGINAYYDYRNSKRKNYNQIGVGLEYLLNRWEFRVNGYFPFGKRVSDLFDLGFSHFTGHSVFVSRKHEFAMIGCDGEAGWHFANWNQNDFYLGAGPYYFQGHLGKPAIGGKVRLKGRFGKFLSLEIGDSYDAVFHNRFHGEIALTFSFGPKHRPYSCPDLNTFQKWVYDPPNRNEMIVLDTRKKTSIAIDPMNGLPYVFWFVDNTSHSSGTFESPYPTLAEAQASSRADDVIYVFPGDGTATGMDQGIVLKDNQQFLGSGTAQQLQTTLGTVTIPALTSTMPSITYQGIVSPSDVVSLSNNNVVSGFIIQCMNINGLSDTRGIGQSNPLTSIKNLTAINNFIIGGAGSNIGIELQNVGGNVLVADNLISMSLADSETGIHIVNSNINTAKYQIQNNVISCSNPIIINQVDCSNLQMTLADNSIQGAMQGILFNVADTGLFPNNSLAIRNNSIIELNDCMDLQIIGESSFELYITDNTLTSSATCLRLEPAVNSRSTSVISGNTMTVINGSNPLNISMSGNAVHTATVTGNNFKAVDIDSAFVTAVNAAAFSGVFRDNIFENEITFGLHVQPQSTIPMNLEITNNQFIGGFFGLNIDSNANFNASIDQNIFSNHSNASINISTVAATDTVLQIHDNTFNAPASRAAIITNSGNSLCLSFIDNTSNPIQTYSSAPQGVYFFQNNAGTFNLEPISSNTGLFDFMGGITNVPQGTCP